MKTCKKNDCYDDTKINLCKLSWNKSCNVFLLQKVNDSSALSNPGYILGFIFRCWEKFPILILFSFPIAFFPCSHVRICLAFFFFLHDFQNVVRQNKQKSKNTSPAFCYNLVAITHIKDGKKVPTGGSENLSER